jgi:hypothetical protein
VRRFVAALVFCFSFGVRRFVAAFFGFSCFDLECGVLSPL